MTLLDEAGAVIVGKDETRGDPRDCWARTVKLINARFDTTFEPHDWAVICILAKIAREEYAYDRDNPRDWAGYSELYAKLREAQKKIDEPRKGVIDA